MLARFKPQTEHPGQTALIKGGYQETLRPTLRASEVILSRVKEVFAGIP